ncbi:MAG: universal stress protein [Hyphomicrobiales bacterium]
MSALPATAGGPILVAVDFSADSELALVWAARQAELEGAPLIVLHVVHDPAASPGFYRKPDENWLRPMVDVAEDMMAEFLKSAKAEHPDLPALASARADLVSGLPAGRIVETAQDESARLVVVGSRGRTGLETILLGSVAERVAQTCPVPVVIVKAPDAGP